MNETFAFVTITDLANMYELVANIDENHDYTDVAIVIKSETPEIWDNEHWLLDKLMPIAKLVCNGLMTYEDGAVELREGWGPVTEEDVCTIHNLFESAKELGIIEEYSTGTTFSAN